MKVVKKVFKNKVFKDKGGKEHKSTMFVIVLENGVEVPFKPIFNKDYAVLDAIKNEVKVY